jgi:hypothetical protein
MAITACFASPLFTLLAGASGAAWWPMHWATAPMRKLLTLPSTTRAHVPPVPAPPLARAPGLVSSLAYAARHGDVQLPRLVSLRVLYGSCVVVLLLWLFSVPCMFGWRLDRRVGLLALVLYGAFQVAYMSAVRQEI